MKIVWDRLEVAFMLVDSTTRAAAARRTRSLAASTDSTFSRCTPVTSASPSGLCRMVCLSLCVEPGRSRSRTWSL